MKHLPTLSMRYCNLSYKTSSYTLCAYNTNCLSFSSSHICSSSTLFFFFFILCSSYTTEIIHLTLSAILLSSSNSCLPFPIFDVVKTFSCVNLFNEFFCSLLSCFSSSNNLISPFSFPFLSPPILFLIHLHPYAPNPKCELLWSLLHISVIY